METNGAAELLTPSLVVVFAGLVIPGFVAMLAYRLRQPGETVVLKDRFLEALAFGLVHLIVTWPIIAVLISLVANPINLAFLNGLKLYFGIIAESLAIPVAWGFLGDWALGRLEKSGLVLRRPHNGWDKFFMTRQPAKILVHLKGGELLGGQFGPSSYAGLFPNSGSIYLEKLWKISEGGSFEAPIFDSIGAILRPDDYDFIELFAPDPEHPPLEFEN